PALPGKGGNGSDGTTGGNGGNSGLGSDGNIPGTVTLSSLGAMSLGDVFAWGGPGSVLNYSNVGGGNGGNGSTGAGGNGGGLLRPGNGANGGTIVISAGGPLTVGDIQSHGGDAGSMYTNLGGAVSTKAGDGGNGAVGGAGGSIGSLLIPGAPSVGGAG